VTTAATRHEALADAAARHSIEYRLDSTLFVEAGAGSGKTGALVSRIVQLLRSGACELDDLAAITFTEAAALELKDRVRRSLTDLAQRGRDGPERRRVQAALDRLDEAAVSTIHGFCQRLLSEHPIEAGLPPRFEILDEVRQSLAWRRHWSSVLDRLGADDSMLRLFGVAALIGVTPTHLRDLAKEVGEQWDQCGDIGPDVESVLGSVAASVERGTAAVVSLLEDALALEGHCLDPDDTLLPRLREARDLRDLLTAPGDLEDAAADPRIALLASKQPSLRAGNSGQKGAWSCDLEAVRGCLQAARLAREGATAEVADVVLPAIVATFDVVAREAAATRRAEGTLVFHDLLVLARDLLLERPAVLAEVRRKLKYLLIDEFQDTDPLQLEIAELIGGGQPGGAQRAGSSPPASPVEAGRLFFVGDPKQSIYRFRGADLGTYERARARLAGGAPVALTSNFRSVPGIIEFANECFTTLMGDGYSRLEPVRSPGVATPVRIVGGRLDHSLRRRQQRLLESEACATVIERAVRREGWLVGEGESLRAACLSDVAILVPRRTGLEELEAALDAHGIGYRVESASLIYRSQEVRDLLALCRAIDDPADYVALLAALRSPAFACRDDELYAFRHGGGSWSVEGPQAGAVEGVVAESLAAIRGYRARRLGLGPVGVLEEAVRDRRLLQLAAGSPRERESWRRVRFLIERARAFVEGGGGGLREFADWVDEQLSEGLRSVESVLPEPDEDVVHILTVHAAKGLEYPIAVLAGFGTSDDVPRGVGRRLLRSSGGRVEVHLRSDLRTAGFEALKTVELALERAEAVRVLYVAATRARDHLVVCAHHVPSGDEGTLGQRLYEAATEALERRPGLWEAIDEPASHAETSQLGPSEAMLGPVAQGSLFDLAAVAATGAVVARRAAHRPASSPEEWQTWRRQRAELLARVGRRVSVRATEVAVVAGLAWPSGGSLDEDDAVRRAQGELDWVSGIDAGTPGRPRRGRGGTQLGRAVHATLQAIGQETARQLSLGGAPSPELHDLAEAQARAERIGDRAGEVEQLAAAALSSPTVRAAFSSGSARREVYVATTIGGVVLDGYVDLCFEDGGELTVVDYKTDTVQDRAEVEASAERYCLQAAAYALALADASGLPVRRCVLVFLSPPGRPLEFEVPDLAAALQRVRAVVGAE
jgi:ATP-dependent helicase/nuclease subunit A